METILFTKSTASVEETEAVGAEIARLAGDDGFIALFGDLGAGKTALTRGIASVVTPGAFVCSPTYTIVNEYGEGKHRLFHFDMYRIEDEDSLDSIGFWDYFGRGVIVTEWSENIPWALPEEYLKVVLEKTGDETRKITLFKVEK
ncbi:MAG: tRNA (adenosine(37)-N6)-threonylcarbamoyltransferase complex ATPase subunit type 1 TsaE [Clostridia bacterium]|nr:tRNA (adenosine(37)-N6)-threonylcarbamoyltransferase complex ATPase subunit type 1 TsaE [Clostridia bacterium]